ncbi:IS3 family transposase [Noviherbaspirillum suwonense]
MSRSGLYKTRRRVSEPGIRAVFAASYQSYGSRRLVTALVNRGVSVGRFKVHSLMRRAGLKPMWKHKFVHTNSNHELPIADNVLTATSIRAAPSKAYVPDITYIHSHWC